MVGHVLSELNFLKKVVIFSDKCSSKDLIKLDEDFKLDLKNKPFTKVCISRYLKNTEKKVKQKENEEEEEDKKDEDKSKIIETNLSLNPKVNYLLATALAGQIKTNPCLIEFKLLYFRLH